MNVKKIEEIQPAQIAGKKTYEMKITVDEDELKNFIDTSNNLSFITEK